LWCPTLFLCPVIMRHVNTRHNRIIQILAEISPIERELGNLCGDSSAILWTRARTEHSAAEQVSKSTVHIGYKMRLWQGEEHDLKRPRESDEISVHRQQRNSRSSRLEHSGSNLRDRSPWVMVPHQLPKLSQAFTHWKNSWETCFWLWVVRSQLISYSLEVFHRKCWTCRALSCFPKSQSQIPKSAIQSTLSRIQ